jgi:hypothetical protein
MLFQLSMCLTLLLFHCWGFLDRGVIAQPQGQDCITVSESWEILDAIEFARENLQPTLSICLDTDAEQYAVCSLMATHAALGLRLNGFRQIHMLKKYK